MLTQRPSLGFDAFVNDIATVIAEHVAPGDAAASVTASATALPPADPFVLDHQKVVWHYPDTAGRIIEDLT